MAKTYSVDNPRRRLLRIPCVPIMRARSEQVDLCLAPLVFTTRSGKNDPRRGRHQHQPLSLLCRTAPKEARELARRLAFIPVAGRRAMRCRRRCHRQVAQLEDPLIIAREYR